MQVAAAQQLADLRFGIVESEGVQPLSSVARAHLQAEVLAQHVQQERAQLRSRRHMEQMAARAQAVQRVPARVQRQH